MPLGMANISDVQIEATPLISNNDPNRVDGFNKVSPIDVTMPSPLTEQEKSKVMEIVQKDAQVNGILQQGSWRLLFINPVSDENSNRVGAQAHILLDKAQWFEGSYVSPFSKTEVKTKLWLSALDVFVNLDTNTVTGMEPGIAQRPGVTPAGRDEPRAKNMAIEHASKELRSRNIHANLLAMIQTPDHPKGLAAFMITENGEDKMIVSVDLDRLAIDEGRTGRVVK